LPFDLATAGSRLATAAGAAASGVGWGLPDARSCTRVFICAFATSSGVGAPVDVMRFTSVPDQHGRSEYTVRVPSWHRNIVCACALPAHNNTSTAQFVACRIHVARTVAGAWSVRTQTSNPLARRNAFARRLSPRMYADVMMGARPLRIGILGAARVARYALVWPARACEQVSLQAIASRDAARGQRFAARFGIPKVHASYDALIADREIDAVYVALPNSLHALWSIRALAAGKHVLCEKPLASNECEAHDIARAASDADRVFM
jgi:hypothetical protein